jgi:transposase
MVLSRSRQKFIYFQSHACTTTTAIYAHELAFEFFRGIPLEIIYDQDRVFIQEENLGDILLTDGFRSFCDSNPFEPIFCRKDDPESKGKIENVIKYVKHNFLRGRLYKSLGILQKEALEWLKRSGNGKVHGSTFSKLSLLQYCPNGCCLKVLSIKTTALPTGAIIIVSPQELIAGRAPKYCWKLKEVACVFIV